MRSVSTLVLSLVLVAGCSGRSGSDAGVDAGPLPDAGSDAGGGSRFEATVLVYGPTVLETHPGAMMTVALDLPQGGRREAMTDATGHVAFDGVDFSHGGTASLTVASARRAASSVGLVAADSPVHLELIDDVPVMGNPTFHTVSGTALHMMDPAHFLTVSATIPATLAQAPGAAYSLSVAPDTAFKLVGLEWQPSPTPPVHGAAQTYLQWVVLDQPAAAADRTVPLDFATPTTPMHASGTYTLPTRAGGPLLDASSVPYLGVTQAGPGRAYLGGQTNIAIGTTPAQVTFAAEFVMPLPATQVVTEYNAGTPAEFAGVIVPGYPVGGAQPIAVPDVPTTTDPFTARGLHDEVAWTPNGDSPPNGFRVDRGTDLVWYVAVPAGATSVRIPELPSTADAAAILGTAALHGRPFLCMPGAAPRPYCSRYALGRAVTMMR